MTVRTKNIPLWVTAFAIILALYCTATGIVGLFDPTSVADYTIGADNLAMAWAGRMAATGIALALAVYLKSPHAYVVAWGASIFRELGDTFAAMSGTADGFPAAVVLIVLLIDIIALVLSWRAIDHT